MENQPKQTSFAADCLMDALLRLMQKKPLAEISITELTRTAGVGRVSFYRNFESKQAVLARKLGLLLQEWGADFEAHGDEKYFAESLFRHYYRHRDVYLLVYRQGLSALIYDSIRAACKLEEAANPIERYVRSTMAGMVFGMVDEWMRGGMRETPDEILQLAAALEASGPQKQP